MALFLFATAFAGFIFFLLVAAIATSVDRRPLSQVATDAARETVEEKLPGIIGGIVAKTLGFDLPDGVPLNRLQFELRVMKHLRQHGASFDNARAQALTAVAAYLSDEKIEYGDERYSWDGSAAREVADEYEVRHWEFAP